MSVADISLLASVLVIVLVVAKMLRAIRLLDGRVTILQEQLKFGRVAAARSADNLPVVGKPASGKTPVRDVPIAPAAAPRTPVPPTAAEDADAAGNFPSEGGAHYIDQAEADAVWARMEAEQERLKKAMGRDFQVRAAQLKMEPVRSAAAVRGKPTESGGRPTPAPGRPAKRALSSQELARKLERK